MAHARDLRFESTGPAAVQLDSSVAAVRRVSTRPAAARCNSRPRAAQPWIFAQPSLYKGFVLPPLARPRHAVRGSRGRGLGSLKAHPGPIAALVLATLAWSGLARAQAPGEPAASTADKPPPKPAPAPSGGKTGPGGKKVISLDDEFLVEGKLEKPSAFYVLRRSSTDYDWARLDATMTPLVLESVWDPLF